MEKRDSAVSNPLSYENYIRNGKWEVIIHKVTLKLGVPDVDFRAESRSFKVHKKVLEKYSPVMKVKLSDVWQTSGDVLQLDEEYVEPEVIPNLLAWIYFKYEDRYWWPKILNPYSLCIAAHYLMISELVSCCCKKLRNSITPDNFYDFYTLSTHLNLHSLRQACECAIENMPNDFFLSPQVVEWKVEDLKVFIEKWLKNRYQDLNQTHETILLSLSIWVDSFEDRFRESEKLLEFVLPEALSSDAILQFMETEFYSRLDESHRKQYSVRSYLPTGVSSRDKLYFVCRNIHCPGQSATWWWSSTVHCLDLSVGGQWSQRAGQQNTPNQEDLYKIENPLMNNRHWLNELLSAKPVLGISCSKKIYFLESVALNIKYIKVFSSETDQWLPSKLMKPLDGPNHQMIAGVVLNDFIYITVRAKREVADRRFRRLCLKNNQWKTLKDMQTARLAHSLVEIDGFIYAIGGEVSENETTNNELKGKTPTKNLFAALAPSTFRKVLRLETLKETLENPPSYQFEPDQVPRPERYNPQTDRWEYIAPSHYHHRLSAAVAHEGQIYVISKASFEAYSPETDRWTKLPVPRVCLGPMLMSIAGRLWLLTDSLFSKS